MKLLLALLVACTGVHENPGALVPLSAIGHACDDTHPCGGGAVCGSCGIATGQCTVECGMNGSGSAAGCPDGTFCSNAWTGTQTRYCVRLCDQDSACLLPTGNSQLSCNDGYVDTGTAPTICNVPNGSAAACH